MKFSELYEGWRNNLLPPSRLKELIEVTASDRIDICLQCEKHSKNSKSLRLDAHCIECGCTLSAKTKCLSCSCPLLKWNAIVTEKEEEFITQKLKMPIFFKKFLPKK
jgi:hypothetical protein